MGKVLIRLERTTNYHYCLTALVERALVCAFPYYHYGSNSLGSLGDDRFQMKHSWHWSSRSPSPTLLCKFPQVSRFSGFPMNEECKEKCRCFCLALIAIWHEPASWQLLVGVASVFHDLIPLWKIGKSGQEKKSSGPETTYALPDSVSTLLWGPALPSGCVNRCVCFSERFAPMDACFLDTDVLNPETLYTVLSFTFPSNQVKSFKLIRFYYFRSESQSL